MRHLFYNGKAIQKRLTNKNVFLFLDYDGTLTPIVDTPKFANISKNTKVLLKELAESSRIKLAIISGRALKDIKNKIGLKNIIYGGNHGLEIEGPDTKFKISVPARYRVILQKIKDDLNANISTIKGILVEDKGLSLSIHYRLVNSKQIPKVKTILHKITKTYTAQHKIKINLGKKVFEIRPPLEWNKGKVVSWLLNKWESKLKKENIIPIYIGDDVTDEDAFKVLKNEGITVFVGKPKASFAEYYLKNTKEVFEFLKSISSSIV